MKKIRSFIFLIIMTIPILSGCWNQKELTDLAFVMAMGIDKGKNNTFQVSFQLVNPGNVTTGQGGGGQGLPIAVYKSSGRTLTEAARNATKKISRRLYYAHTNILVISEEVARDKNLLLNVLDPLARDPEFRTTTELIVTRDCTAEELISTLTNIEKLPANKLTKELKTTESMLGENMRVSIDDFIDGIISKGKEPIVNGYKLVGKKAAGRTADNLQKTTADAYLSADGLGIFKNGKLTDWIDGYKARGVMWVLDKVKSTDINVKWNGKQNALSVVPIRSKTKVSPTFQNGNPVINIKIENEGWISEANTDIDLMNPTVIAKIEMEVEKVIEKEVQTSVREAQKEKYDIFGFGEGIHKANPALWRRLEKNWNSNFANIEVKVNADSYVRREGVRTIPFWSNLNK